MKCMLEHANITVRDADETIRFITTAFPHFRVRGGGTSDHGDWRKKWCHLGTDDIYIAIEQTSCAAVHQRKVEQTTGYNHVGFVVDDVEDIQRKMDAAGYSNAMTDPHPFRKRLYVTDRDGLTWEFIEYLSDDPAEKNDYSL